MDGLVVRVIIWCCEGDGGWGWEAWVFCKRFSEHGVWLWSLGCFLFFVGLIMNRDILFALGLVFKLDVQN